MKKIRIYIEVMDETNKKFIADEMLGAFTVLHELLSSGWQLHSIGQTEDGDQLCVILAND